MDAQEYKAPEVLVEIDGLSYYQPTSAEVRSSRIHPVDAATVVLPPEVEPKPGQSFHLYMGYDSTLALVFGGQVDDVDLGARVTVRAVDVLGASKKQPISVSLSNCLLVEVFQEICSQAGLVGLCGHDMRILPRFAVWDMNPIQALAAMQRAFGVKWDLWSEPEGFVWCGPLEESARSMDDELIVLEQGVNILAIRPGEEMFEVDCVFNPWITHTKRVTTFAPEIFPGMKIMQVERVRHSYDELKTELQCRVL